MYDCCSYLIECDIFLFLSVGFGLVTGVDCDEERMLDAKD